MPRIMVNIFHFERKFKPEQKPELLSIIQAACCNPHPTLSRKSADVPLLASFVCFPHLDAAFFFCPAAFYPLSLQGFGLEVWRFWGLSALTVSLGNCPSQRVENLLKRLICQLVWQPPGQMWQGQISLSPDVEPDCRGSLSSHVETVLGLRHFIPHMKLGLINVPLWISFCFPWWNHIRLFMRNRIISFHTPSLQVLWDSPSGHWYRIV